MGDSPRIITLLAKEVKNSKGRFKRAMTGRGFVFFLNLSDDSNTEVLVYERKGSSLILISEDNKGMVRLLDYLMKDYEESIEPLFREELLRVKEMVKERRIIENN